MHESALPDSPFPSFRVKTKAYHVALARRSSHHHQPAFILGAPRQPPAPTYAAVFRVFQRQRRATALWRSFEGSSDLKACCSSASTASSSSADAAWRPSMGDLFARDRYRRRCVSYPTQPSLAVSSGSVRALSTRRSGGGYEENTTKSVPFGVDVASAKDSPNTEATEDANTRKAFGDTGNSAAAVVELEPLVERVASALKQRCSVRGGDLVRIFFRFHWATKSFRVHVDTTLLKARFQSRKKLNRA